VKQDFVGIELILELIISEAPLPSYSISLGLFPLAINWQECEINHSLSPRAEVRKMPKGKDKIPVLN
jgi:hypothetical protein